MKIPDPYFENVPLYGTMHMERVIIDYDYPLLSVLKDDEGKRYISICYSVMDAQRWIVVPISDKKLIRLLTNKIPIAAPYQESKSGIVIATRNYSTRQDSFQIISAIDIPDNCLPDADELLNAESDEWTNYIMQIQTEDSDWKQTFYGTPIYINTFLLDAPIGQISSLFKFPASSTTKIEKPFKVKNVQPQYWSVLA